MQAGPPQNKHRLIEQYSWPILAAGLILILTLAAKAGDIFTGVMPDTDDLMRLQQVRDLLEGQDWYDVDQRRFLTPEGGAMHWSRLPDIFLATVIALATPLIGAGHAEALAAVLWPLLLLGLSLWALRTILIRLSVGTAGQVLAVLFLATSAALPNFWPGRIDHHNLVVTLILGGFAAALSPKLSAQSGVFSAFCIAAAISVAIESLPYAAGLILIYGVFWICRGHREGVRLAAFGLSLSSFACVFYIADAPGIGAARAVCDAYGNAHFAGMLGGGVLLAAMGTFGGYLMQWRLRLAAGFVAGLLILGLIVAVQPECLGDPYARVSEEVRLAWLSAVGEARTFAEVAKNDLEKAVWQGGFVVAALGGAILMIIRAPDELRLARAGLGLLLVFSAILTLWQIRGVTFSHVFAAIIAGWAVGTAAEHWWAKRGSRAALILFVAAALFSPSSWQLIASPFDTDSRIDDIRDPDKAYSVLCLKPDAFEILPESPQLKVFTPIDLGISVLSRSPHTVFAGPYHRNIGGIAQVTNVFMGSAESARDKIKALGATHLLYCQGLGETARYAVLRPDSFAAQMEAGRVPSWLALQAGPDETDGTVRLYQVR